MNAYPPAGGLLRSAQSACASIPTSAFYFSIFKF